MDIKDIRYFLMVAQEKSFTRAAEKLYITQPALSRKIAELEAELGMSLINRKGKTIELTSNGVMLQHESRHLARDYDNLLAELDALRRGKGMSLSVAYGMAGHILYLSQAIAKLKKKNAYLDVQTERMFNADILNALANGKLDAGIINLPELPENSGLEYATLLPCGLCVFLPREHPLYHRSSLKLSDLAGQDYITFERETSPNQYDHILRLCREKGLGDKPCAHAPDTSAFSLLLLTQRMVGVMPYTTAVFDNVELRRIPLYDTEGFDMVLVWNRRNDNPALELLKSCF